MRSRRTILGPLSLTSRTLETHTTQHNTEEEINQNHNKLEILRQATRNFHVLKQKQTKEEAQAWQESHKESEIHKGLMWKHSSKLKITQIQRTPNFIPWKTSKKLTWKQAPVIAKELLKES